MSSLDFSLKERVAIVIGARRGIGKAIALALAKSGANVVICDRNAASGELQDAADEIRGISRQCLAIRVDITQKSDVDNLVNNAIDKFGSIDILVNCAVMNVAGSLVELGEENWNKIIDTDLKGYYLCCQAVAQKMMERKRGNIINMASAAAIRAVPNLGAYCIAKAGVVMLTKVLAIELAKYSIRVNAVAPYVVKTKFSQPLISDPENYKAIESQIPLGYIAKPDDITGTVVFLASDVSNYITGEIISIDGGAMAGIIY